jgi:hypothetical protein
MFRFTIRDVLWLMVVVALGAGWWHERSNAARERAARVATDKQVKMLRAQIKRIGSFREMTRPQLPAESLLELPFSIEPDEN